MYVRYKDPLTGTDQVRDVRHFKLRPQDCEEEDGTITHGATLCDGVVERAAYYGGAAVEELAGLLLGSGREVRIRQRQAYDRITTVDRAYTELPECEELKWFSSWEAASEILDKLCMKLAEGRQFFDLTAYDDDAQVVVV